MREIKFEYVYKNENQELSRIVYTIDEIDQGYTPRSFLIARRQYTGLKDSKGVEIYEGDIVKTQVWTQIGEGVSSGDWYIGEIMYSKGSFYGHFRKPEVMEYLQFFRYEVIGNIYENPELLEQQ